LLLDGLVFNEDLLQAKTNGFAVQSGADGLTATFSSERNDE
jgi:hypothetical protein